MFLLPLRLWHL